MKNETSEEHGSHEPRRERNPSATLLAAFARTFAGSPSGRVAAWAQTTGAVVLLLLILQMWTGALLAFYYVPSVEAAHATVAFVEKVAAGGSWIRALHFYCSQLLPLALALHLLQLLWREAYVRRPFTWVISLLLLALVLANGATGYSLPWDARAFYGTRVAAGISGGLPLVGGVARRWLLGGDDPSSLTLTRFYALHILVVPFLILAALALRLSLAHAPDESDEINLGIQRDEKKARRRAWLRAQLARHAVVAGVVFCALALYASKYPAPLGPPAEGADSGYLPRPGAQFLWLFQMFEYLPTRAASLAALLVPGALLLGLASLPFLPLARLERLMRGARRKIGLTLFLLGFALVAGLTAVARWEDARDPRVREQLERQTRDEEAFRIAPFEPLGARGESVREAAAMATPDNAGSQPGIPGAEASDASEPPAVYAQHCARCHGAHGEGKSINPPLIGVSARPRRTMEDIVRILENPRAYGLERRMPSFATKLSAEEKRVVAGWVASLRP